jgi:hypothetical protein
MLVRAGSLAFRQRPSSSDEYWVIGICAGYMFLMFLRSLAGPSFQVLHFNLFILLLIAVVLEATALLDRRKVAPKPGGREGRRLHADLTPDTP